TRSDGVAGMQLAAAEPRVESAAKNARSRIDGQGAAATHRDTGQRRRGAADLDADGGNGCPQVHDITAGRDGDIAAAQGAGALLKLIEHDSPAGGADTAEPGAQ